MAEQKQVSVPEGWGNMGILDRLRAVGGDPAYYMQVRKAFGEMEAERARAEQKTAERVRGLAGVEARLVKARKDLAASVAAEAELARSVDEAAALFAREGSDARERRVVELSAQLAAGKRRTTAARALVGDLEAEREGAQGDADLAALEEAKRGASRDAWLESIRPEVERIAKIAGELGAIGEILATKAREHNARRHALRAFAAKVGEPVGGMSPVHANEAAILVRRRLEGEPARSAGAPRIADWIG